MNTSAAHPPPNLWFTRERILTLLLAGATLLSLYLCYLIAKPFIAPIAFALALAVATARPFGWLAARISNNTVAAVLGVFAVFFLIIGPSVLLGAYVIDKVVAGLEEFRTPGANNDWRSIIERFPAFAVVFHWAESRFDLSNEISQLGSVAAKQVTSVVRGSLNVLTQLGIMLFVLFFLFRDRKGALRSVRMLLPLEEFETDRVFRRVADTIEATVSGSLMVAALQATLAGAMYTFLAVPGAAVWAALTFIMALIPVFGTFLVWGPISLYLAFSGDLTKAAILAGWGVAAVGTIDNFVYPYLVGGRLRIHPVITFFSIVGGIAVFGPVGLILGPLAVAIAMALVDIWWSRTTDGRAAEETISTDPAPRPPSRAVQDRISGSTSSAEGPALQESVDATRLSR